MTDNQDSEQQIIRIMQDSEQQIIRIMHSKKLRFVVALLLGLSAVGQSDFLMIASVHVKSGGWRTVLIYIIGVIAILAQLSASMLLILDSFKETNDRP